MKKISKVEIIADPVEVGSIIEILQELGLDGYSVIRGVVGRGRRGQVMDDGDLTGVLQNQYLLVACPPERVGELVERVRPLLKRVGGICLVSDAQWVIH